MPWHWDTGHFTADPISLLELIEAAKLSQMHSRTKRTSFALSSSYFLTFLRMETSRTEFMLPRVSMQQLMLLVLL